MALKIALRAARFLNDFLLSESFAKEDNLLSGSAAWLDDKTTEKIFFLWQDFLNRLEDSVCSGVKIDFEFIYSQFILRALDFLGFLPDIFSCFECGQRLEGKDSLFSQTNFFCFDCARKKTLSGQVISVQTLSLIKQILASVWFNQAETAQEVKILTNSFLAQAYNFML
ncbi:MAG: DNA repair protein RecO C-terminal domain-containing protein [Candidatus Paceibacteria bacterium]